MAVVEMAVLKLVLKEDKIGKRVAKQAPEFEAQ